MKSETVHPASELREQIGEFATRLGNGAHNVEAWYVADCDRKGKPERVTVVELRGPDTGYTRPSYAQLSDGRHVCCTYLFSRRPRFVAIQDDFGRCHNWAVV